MLVFLVGEGPHDIGGLAATPPYRTDAPGFIQPIVERVVHSETSFAGQKVAALGKARVKGIHDALARKAHIAAALAAHADAQLLVFVTDLDGGQNTRTKAQRRAEIKRKSEAIIEGARSFEEGAISCAPGIPCRTIEAWALADPDAVERICANPVVLPSNKTPEALWGAPHDADSNHPKSVLARILGRRATRQDLAEIAQQSDITQIRSVCELSFEPFVSALESADSTG